MKKEFKKRTNSAKTWHFRTKLSAALSLMCIVSSTSMYGIRPDREDSVHGEGSGNVSMSDSEASSSLPHGSYKIDSEGAPSSMTALLDGGFNKGDKQASDSGNVSMSDSEASSSLPHGSYKIDVELPEGKGCCDVLQKPSCGTGTRIATSLAVFGASVGATFAGLWQAGYLPAQDVATHEGAASMAQPLPPVPCFDITSDDTTVSFTETCVQDTCDTLSFGTMQEACNRTVVKGSADEAFARIVAEQVASGQSVRVNMTQFMVQDQETGEYQTLVSRSAFNEAIDRHNLTAIDLSFDGTTGTITWDNLGLFVDDFNTPATTTTAEPTTTTPYLDGPKNRPLTAAHTE